MTRTGWFKGVYFGILLVGLALGAWLGLTLVGGGVGGATGVGIVVVVLVFLLARRILAFFWADLLRGLRLLRAKDYAGSKSYSERFLADVRARPWLKGLIWLGTSSYSRDPEALALTNLAAAEIGLGEFAAARAHLEAAIDVDPKNPLAFHNMAVLSLHTGKMVDAAPWYEKAKALGYTGGLGDQLVMASQQRFASIPPDSARPAAPQSPAPRTPADTPETGAFIVELINDDVTPMEFVISVLEDVFDKTFIEARSIMFEVDQKGRGVGGAYDQPTAEAKAQEAMASARSRGFPLTLVVSANPQA